VNTSTMVASRNSEIARGVQRFSRSAMYAKRYAWKYTKGSTTKIEKKKRPALKEKVIGGDKNGEKRMVPTKRFPKYYPTESPRRKLKSRGKKPYADHTRKLRASITPGTVLIPLAGPHKGKHVVFLKQLDSGLLLVTGPHKINGCPLRRVNQVYVIATKTKIDISSVEIPEKLNDTYFKRKKLNKPKHGDGEIFDTEEESYTVSDERKADQKALDNQLMKVVKSTEYLEGYLCSKFGLQTGQYPHNMVF